MNIKILLAFVFLLFCSCKQISVFAQLQTYQFEQIDSLQKIEARPVFIFIHTTWCKYCTAMGQTTFKDKQTIAALNKKYYCIFLDAEIQKDIFFNNHLFKYKATGNNTGVHELAVLLGTTNGQVSYPAICILNADYEIIFQYSSFLSSVDLLKILHAILNSP